MNLCLSPEQVERYLFGTCCEDEQKAIEIHITECETCRQQIESVRLAKGASSQSDLILTRDITIDCNTEDKPSSYVSEDKHSTKTISPTSSISQTPPVAGSASGSMFEDYKILEQLPPGGQAIVYKAIQKATKRVVALKVLLQGPQISLPAQYRFEREVDLAASLQHPNIVTIYDSGIAKGQYYFAMQYIEGKPLDEYIQTEKLSQRQTMELFNHICSAVAYAHQRGVMHRDLKPGNILVDDEGQPHILDFGLAKLTDDSEQISPEATMTSIPGKVIGTLAFMSPEQASAQPDSVDVRTDVYSIGVILYKILTGNFPYDVTGSMLAILRNIQEAEPTRPSNIVPRFHSEIEAILLKALSKDPAVRYQSAAHLAQDIDFWLTGLPVSARSDSSLYLLRKIITKHYYASSVVALLLIIVLGFSYFSYQLYTRLRESNRTLQDTIQSLNQETAQYSYFARKITFTDFLQTWSAGNLKHSEFIAKFLTGGTREGVAASFLLNTKPLADKTAKFRQRLEGNEPCFVEFIIGEHYLKDGNKGGALEAYRNCILQTEHLRNDPWLATHIKSRLYELAGENVQDKDSVIFEN
jgi:serine/threonine protein kinase